MPSASSTPGGIRTVLPALCVTVTLSYGTLYYAFAVLAPSIRAETGWSLTALTAAFSLGNAVTGLAGVAVGRMIQAGGPRGVMTAGALAGAAGLAALALAPTFGVFVAGMVLCGVGGAGLFYPPAFAALIAWHDPRGVEAVTALTLVAGFASTVFAPLTTALAGSLGWRGTYLLYAALVAAVAVPLHLLALAPPWPSAVRSASTEPLGDVIASRTFLLLAVGSGLTMLTMYASLIALVPLLLARGYSPGTAAWALGLGGAGQVAGRVVYPWLTRAIGLPSRVTLATVGLTLTVALFAVVDGPTELVVAVSVLAGAARGLFTLVVATVVSDLWGPRRYASVNGVLGAPLALAMALGPFVGAAIAEVTGYPPAFAVLAGISAAGTCLFVLASTREPADGAR